MTPRIRIFLALALIAVLAVPVGVALAGRHGSADVATASGTSITSTTNAPTTTAAPSTTAEVVTTETPSTDVPSTDAAPVASTETTAAPAKPAAAARQTVATDPVPVTFPAPPPAPPTTQAPDVKTALAQAAAIKKADDDAAKAAADAAPPVPLPQLDPDPPTKPAPVATDDPLQQLSASDQQFLACVRWRESRDDYTVVNRSSGAGGAYQFLQSTWNNTAAHAGRGDLIGLKPNWASVHDQDLIAVTLLQWYGRSPWAGPGC